MRGEGQYIQKIRRNNGRRNKSIMGKRTVGCKQPRECDQFPVPF